MASKSKGVREVWLGATLRDDADELSSVIARFVTAFGHVIYCKYATTAKPVASCFADDAKHQYSRTTDAFVANYIDNAEKTVSRWLKHERLRRVEAVFLDSEGRVVVEYSIDVYKAPAGGMLRRINKFSIALRQLKLDLGKLLTEIEAAPVWPNVSNDQLYEFKLRYSFTEPLRLVPRNTEHPWKQVPPSNKPRKSTKTTEKPPLMDSVAELSPESSELFAMKLLTKKFQF
uniref:HORMA domain-containing protein n=1 Tax=Panagrellus redivivus TaxID=6233 RepID=A0A7E4ULG9_PANRE